MGAIQGTPRAGPSDVQANPMRPMGSSRMTYRSHQSRASGDTDSDPFLLLR